MKAYVCHSTGFDYEKELYEPLRAVAGHEFVFPHGTGDDAHSKEAIASCDLVIAEVSRPSTGMGIEIGWADAAGIPVHCIHRSDAKPSAALRHVAKSMTAYDGPADLAATVERILSEAS